MKRVLLADDSVAARRSIQTMLEMAGIDVVAVGNGDLALSRIDEVTPQMVLLDAIMPGRSGYEVCAEIKADPARASLPVLLVTTEFEPFDERAAAEAGADGHLVKPFDAEAIARMREVWDRYAPDDADRFAEVAARSADAPAEAASAPEPPVVAAAAAEQEGAVPAPESFITSTMRAPELPDEAAPEVAADEPEPAPYDLALPAARASAAAGPAAGRDTPLPDRAVEAAAAPSGGRVLRAPTTENLELETPEYMEAWERAGVEANISSVSLSELRVVGERCPACGIATASGDIFCLACGAMVLVTPDEAVRLERSSYCPACRQELMPGEVFCLACGAAV